MGMQVEIIGYDCGWGCRDWRCEDGPAGVQPDEILRVLRDRDIAATWRGSLGLKSLGDHADVKTKSDGLPLLLESVRRLSDTVMNAARQGRIPVVIGGDHSSAIGTWSGLAAAKGSFGKFGLIWLDAHLDAHTLETSHQGKWGGWWHGQPVTALMGHGLAALQHVGGLAPKIAPQHLTLIGPHSFEPGEQDFVTRQKIRVHYLPETRARGFAACYAEALARATDGTEGFGLTIDLDAFRPEDAPGVGTTESEGLAAAEVLAAIRGIGRNPLFCGLEIAEFNPHQDRMNKTRQLIVNIIESVFS